MIDDKTIRGFIGLTMLMSQMRFKRVFTSKSCRAKITLQYWFTSSFNMLMHFMNSQTSTSTERSATVRTWKHFAVDVLIIFMAVMGSEGFTLSKCLFAYITL
jgi:hypothetical protein